MNNLRGFIQAAKEANMLEEVATLENNLRMLQQEFRRQKVPLSPSEKEDDTVAAVKKQVIFENSGKQTFFCYTFAYLCQTFK